MLTALALGRCPAHQIATLAAVACSSLAEAMSLRKSIISAGGVSGTNNSGSHASSSARPLPAVPTRSFASGSLRQGHVTTAAAANSSARSDPRLGHKLPKTMLHVNGIGKSYARVLRDTHGIQTVEQLTEKIIEKLQMPDGVITVAPAVQLLQGYGIKRQDHAQRIITHLTSLYAPDLHQKMQAADAAADSQNRPGITFCVEGNISAGKSTFLNYITQDNEELQQELGVVHEPVDQWQSVPTVMGETLNLLDRFYSDPPRYAYTFQNYVFMSRVLQERNSAGMQKPVRVMERSVFSDRMVFVRAVRESGWMGDVELAVYDSWFNPILEQSPHLRPHGFIYLKCDPSTCMDRLKLRGRSEEDNISIDYLEGLHAKHEDWLGAGQLAYNVHSKMSSRRRSTSVNGLLVPDTLRDSLYYLDKDSSQVPPDMHESLHLVPALVLDCNRDVLRDYDARLDVQEKVLKYIGFMREHTTWQRLQHDSKEKLRRAMEGAAGLDNHSGLLVLGCGAQPGSPQGQQQEAVETLREGLREGLKDSAEVKLVPNCSGVLTNDTDSSSRRPTGSLEVLQAATARQQQAVLATA